jgi:hypothetical protein
MKEYCLAVCGKSKILQSRMFDGLIFYHSTANCDMVTSLLTPFKSVPVTLFRIQVKDKMKLREKARQEKLHRSSYDFILQPDGLVHPSIGNTFTFPNGASLRPLGPVLKEIIANFRGNCIFVVPKDTPIPDDLILLHEHSDHYSLQTSSPCTERQLNQRLQNFFMNLPQMDKPTFFKTYGSGDTF